MKRAWRRCRLPVRLMWSGASVAPLCWGRGSSPACATHLFGFQVFGQNEEFAEQPQGAEFSDAGHAAQALDLGLQVGLASGEFGGGLLQGFDSLLEMLEVRREIGGDEPGAIRRVGDGMEPGLLAGHFFAEVDEAATELPQGQDSLRRRGPRDEVHAGEELEEAQGIDAIGLGAGQSGALEVFARPWIDDHDGDAFGPLQGEGQAQAVNARGFQTHAGAGTPPGQQFDELPVAGGRIGQGDGTFQEIIAPQRDDQFGGPDVDPGTDDRSGFWRLFHPVDLGLVWSLRAPDSVQMSSTDLVNTGSPPRQRDGGLRYFASTRRCCPSGRLRRAISLRSVPAWTKESGDRSNEQGRGGAFTPPCPQASAASRKRMHPLPKPTPLAAFFSTKARYKAFARAP